ncbi:MAG: G-D-S-L family lipolytic protein [Flavobacteriaceae bacterium]|nr:G-D-S-L family lipolytic protein [Eudoraea sp.]NNK20897.1 G-D-S-L family lipolytic protein [Flavobacteriaceae bacterium]
MKKFYALLAFTGVLLISCSDDDTTMTTTPPPDPVNYTSGSADFSNYVAVGNSITAGYSDQALFIDGQTNSFPNMLAENFALAGGGAFTIPFMADNLGGATLGGQTILGNRLILSFASGSPAPVPVSGQGATEISNTLTGPFNNMGVPGAKSFHLAASGYGNVAGVPLGQANPYYARFASSPSATIIGDAVAQNPTFFTLWIGNNDVLGFAASGGDGVDQTGNIDPTSYGGNDITDPNVFAGVYNGLLQGLTANGADGVVINIPDVSALPYFTTVPYNAIPLDEATAGVVNQAYLPYNGGIQQALAALDGTGLFTAEEAARRTISFSAGPNAVVIIDEDLTDLGAINPAFAGLPKYRQATPEDLLVLPNLTFLGTLANPSDPTSINGVAVPLADKWVLTPEEQASISVATAAYNQTIAGLAAQYDLAFVDVNTYQSVIADVGAPLSDGSVVTDTYATGGGFSLDGVHPAPRGASLLANLIIQTINTKYGSNLPGVDPLDYTGLYLQ